MSPGDALIGEVVHWWRPESTVKGKPRKHPTCPPVPAIITTVHEGLHEEFRDGLSGKKYGLAILHPRSGTLYEDYTAQSDQPRPGTWTRRTE